MSAPPPVSVMITAYNHADYIEETVRSVLHQTFGDFEVIVADDGSSDATPDILRRLAREDSRVILLLSPVNRGISSNVNAGLDACRGNYIALLSGDDLMYPTKLASQVEVLGADRRVLVCSHDMEVFDSRSGQAPYVSTERFRMKSGGLELLFNTNWFFRTPLRSIPSSTVVRSDFFLRYRFDRRLRIWNEWLHMVECMAAVDGLWRHVNQVLGRYRRHDRQVTSSDWARAISFEEAMMVLTVASVRYPELARLIKNKRDFVLFEHLVRDWHTAEKRKVFSTQFLREAGLVKWLYMKLVHFAMHSPAILAATRPARLAIKRLAAGELKIVG